MAKRTSVTLNFQKVYTDSVKERAALMEKNEKLLTINRDLLAALGQAKRIIRHSPPGGVPGDELEDWFQLARAAIKKAEVTS